MVIKELADSLETTIVVRAVQDNDYTAKFHDGIYIEDEHSTTSIIGVGSDPQYAVQDLIASIVGKTLVNRALGYKIRVPEKLGIGGLFSNSPRERHP